MLKRNDPIRVIATHHAPREHSEVGRYGYFVEHTQNGFARVVLDPKPEWLDQERLDSWLIHPENLEVAD